MDTKRAVHWVGEVVFTGYDTNDSREDAVANCAVWSILSILDESRLWRM